MSQACSYVSLPFGYIPTHGSDCYTPGPDVQEIIADSRTDFDSYPVSTRVNNTRNDFPELLVPLKA